MSASRPALPKLFQHARRLLTAGSSAVCRFAMPPLCLGCGRRLLGEQRWLCEICDDTLRPSVHLMPGGDGAPAAFALPFEGPTRTLVHALKYDGMTGVAEFLADLTLEGLGPLIAAWSMLPRQAHTGGGAAAARPQESSGGTRTVVVPVPLHPARRRDRGFDQSLLIARALASRLGAHLVSNALRRTRWTSTQTSLSGEHRRKNVAGAFRALGTVPGELVLLVDDVVTTGSTIIEARTALQRVVDRPVLALAVAGATHTILTGKAHSVGVSVGVSG